MRDTPTSEPTVSYRCDPSRPRPRRAEGGWRRIVAPALFALQFPVSLVAQELTTAETSRLDSLLAAEVQEDGPGLAAAVVRDGEIVWERGYGLASLEHGVPITPDTRFHLVSGSKQFTAFAIMRMVEDGSISLNDDIRDHLPELPDFGWPLTLDQLLHHTSGLRQTTTLESYAGWTGELIYTQRRALELIHRQEDLNFPPGSAFRYSDSGFILLATLVERLTGERYGPWMREHVFGPLGMDHTVVRDNVWDVIPDMAQPYYRDGGEFLRDRGDRWVFYGGTGVHSTVRDLARWLIYVDDPDPSDEGAVAGLHHPGVLNDGSSIPWAHGLIMDEGPTGHARVWHTGDAPGYHAWVGRYPEARWGIVLLTNFDEVDLSGLADAVAEVLLPATEGDFADPPSPAEQSPTPPVELSPDRMRSIAGLYRADAYPPFLVPRTWEVVLQSGSLFLAPQSGFRIPLEPVNDSTFLLSGAAMTLVAEAVGTDAQSVAILGPDGPDRAQRIAGPPETPSADQVTEYLGLYRSSEVGASYRVTWEDDRLLLRFEAPVAHRRLNPILLSAVGPDLFIGDDPPFAWVRFERDAAGTVTDFLATSGGYRVVDLRFRRQAGTPPT